MKRSNAFVEAACILLFLGLIVALFLPVFAGRKVDHATMQRLSGR